MPLTTRKLHGLAKRKLAELKVSINPESIEVENILTKNLPFFNGLEQNQKKVFLRKVLVFLNSKSFIAMNNFEINLIHCTIISALAVRLAFMLGLKYYDHIISIYLFDSEFLDYGNNQLVGITESNGSISLAWNAIEEGINNHTDGRNVVFHEFAHALDLYDNNFDGMPRIFKTSVVKPLISGIIQAHDNFLNEWQEWHRFTYNYEIKDIAEFYARLTELYFENPVILKNNDQKLYNILLSIYKYEPTPIRLIRN